MNPRHPIAHAFAFLFAGALGALAALLGLIAFTMRPTEHCKDSNERDCVSTSQSVRNQLAIGAFVDAQIAGALIALLLVRPKRESAAVAIVTSVAVCAFTLLALGVLAIIWTNAPMTNPF